MFIICLGFYTCQVHNVKRFWRVIENSGFCLLLLGGNVTTQLVLTVLLYWFEPSICVCECPIAIFICVHSISMLELSY